MEVSLRITIPAERDFYTDETKKALATLKKEIEPHNKNVDKHEAARANVAGSNVEALSVKDLFNGPASKECRFGLHKKAIELCDKVVEFSKIHQADRSAKYKSICEGIASWEKRIREQLTEIGFKKELLHSSHVQSVNLFYRQHPEVQKLIRLELDYRSSDVLRGGDRKALVASMERMASAELRVA